MYTLPGKQKSFYLYLIGNLKMEEARSSNVLVVVLSSTTVLFLVISIPIFIAGFLCGHYLGQKYERSSKKIIPAPPKAHQPVTLYEDVNVLPRTVEYHEKDFELKENVAYGPSTSMNVEQ